MTDLAHAASQGPPWAGLRFRSRHRLEHAREFQSVFRARLRKSAGPMTVHARFLDEPAGRCPRLGLSIGKKVGGAVARNRLKRRVREAFRISQLRIADLAGSHGPLDLVVSMRPHEPLKPIQYAEMIVDSVRRIARDHARRRAKNRAETGSADTDV